MTITLPRVIATYFALDKARDVQAIADCFTPDSVVVDEGNTYAGQDAIRNWMANASTKYTYTVEPFALAEFAGKAVVTSHLVGTFPGSPVDLRYLFTLTDDKIARLEIVPA
jgi:uncharacterized protein (TIGR02246 family)